MKNISSYVMGISIGAIAAVGIKLHSPLIIYLAIGNFIATNIYIFCLIKKLMK